MRNSDTVTDRGSCFFLAVDEIEQEFGTVADTAVFLQQVNQLSQDFLLGLKTPFLERGAFLEGTVLGPP